MIKLAIYCKKMIIIQLGIMVYLTLLLQNLAIAQTETIVVGELEIWNSNIKKAGQGYYSYEFTVDTVGSLKDPISNLVIQTNFGEISFENPFGISFAERYQTGYLVSQEEITAIIILKVIGVVNGKMYNITSSFSVREFRPMLVLIP
jgi:hypothetical protein